MSDPEEFDFAGFDDIPEACPNCDGAGFVLGCPEGTCPWVAGQGCVMLECDWCDGEG